MYISSVSTNNSITPYNDSKNIKNTQSIQKNDKSSSTDKTDKTDNKTEKEPLKNAKKTNINDFSESEKRILAQLRIRDTAVRSHEMAHIAAGGQYITSGAQYSYQRGPDGGNYAVGGEVGIDTSPISGKPEETIAKMQVVRAAALAPADPSAQDQSVASNATKISFSARLESDKINLAKALEKFANKNFDKSGKGSIINIKA